MNTKSKAIFILLSFLYLSCFNEAENFTRKEAIYDSYVIGNLESYDSLFQFLDRNLDTLILHNHPTKRFVKNRGDFTYKRTRFEDCLLLPKSFHRKRIPDELEDEFFDLISLIGKKNISNFQVCIDGTTEITIKSEVAGFADGWHWEKLHKLEYKPKKRKGIHKYEVIRDTMLSEKIRYYVCLYNS